MTPITAQYKGQTVTILNVTGNDKNANVVYVDSGNNLNVSREVLDWTSVFNVSSGINQNSYAGTYNYSTSADQIIPTKSTNFETKPAYVSDYMDTDNLAYGSYATSAGSYAGTNTTVVLTLPFDITYIFIKGDTSAASTAVRIFNQNFWLQRAVVADPIGNLGDVDVYGNTVTITSGPMTVAGTTYHWFAVSDPFATTIQNFNYEGNWLQTDYKSLVGVDAQVVLHKRDNLVPMNYLGSDGSFGAITPVATSGVMTMLPDGTIRCNGDNTVNGGESNDLIAFKRSPFVECFEYTGGNLTTIPTSLSDIDCMIMIPMSAGSYGYGGHMWFQSDATNVYPMYTGAKTSALGISVARGRINISTGQIFNKVGEKYIIVAFEKNRNPVSYGGSITSRSRYTSPSNLILNSGVWIDCGADNSLAVSGDYTLEWYGQSLIATGALGTGNLDANARCLFSRTSGVYGEDNTANYGLWLAYAPYISEFPSFWIAPKNKVNFPTSAVWTEDCWQTGIQPSIRQYQHFMAVCDTSGNYMLYLNGRLVKERKQGDILRSVSGLRMAIGGNYGTTSAADLTNNIVAFSTIRIYDRALSVAEIRNNFLSCGNHKKYASTSDFVEEWKAENFNGTTLLATKNSANNGTIKGGSNWKFFKGL